MEKTPRQKRKERWTDIGERSGGVRKSKMEDQKLVEGKKLVEDGI